ncbi:MAG: hypothetical protein IJK26_04270 [Clostridia bacterium]|nr:hypothetical protein [Clostridia bacterium]
MGRRRKSISLGLIFSVFGIGLVSALLIPSKYLVVILALALVAGGIAICKA